MRAGLQISHSGAGVGDVGVGNSAASCTEAQRKVAEERRGRWFKRRPRHGRARGKEQESGGKQSQMKACESRSTPAVQ